MITIISGTNRPQSSTIKLAAYYQKRFLEKGVEAGLLSLTQLPANSLETDLYGKRSREFQPIQDIVDKTEKFLFFIFFTHPTTLLLQHSLTQTDSLTLPDTF